MNPVIVCLFLLLLISLILAFVRQPMIGTQNQDLVWRGNAFGGANGPTYPIDPNLAGPDTPTVSETPIATVTPVEANISIGGTDAVIRTERPVTQAVCPSGYMYDSGICRKPEMSYPLTGITASCPVDYVNTGSVCRRSADSMLTPSILANCPPGFTNTGINCQRTSGVGTEPLDVATCPPNYVRDGSRCYPICPADYMRQGENCIRPESTLEPRYMTCPEGYFRQGTICYETCKPGYVLRGTQCVSPPDIKGSEIMTCPFEYPELIGSRCYGPCPIGTQPLDTLCVGL